MAYYKKAKKIVHIIIGAITIFFVMASLLIDYASAKNSEKYYQEKWCEGRVEVVMPDRTRCDCLTSRHAVEFDFGRKWAEAIGQSLHYSLQTGKRAGIVLILEKKKDRRYWIRLNSVIMQFDLPIDTWAVGEGK